MSAWTDGERAARRSAQLFLRLSSALATLALALGGCYGRHECGSVEVCNLFDDDCDGLVDEDFVDADGAYRSPEHCGTCGVSCANAFPSAEAVACVDGPEGPACVIASCPPSFHRAGDGACVPDVPVLCLPCTTDADCALRIEGARCLETGSGQARCGQPCDASAPCPDGFACAAGQCAPASGWCGCDESTEGAELACLLRVDEDGHACVGVRRCGAEGPGECEPALGEACNGQDDDCDGAIDEDFRDADGRYVDRLHCGGCAIPCVEPGPNMLAECSPDGAGVRCQIECLEGFVDVDGILANGCECERYDGVGPPPAVGGDADCDGVPDDTDDFVYVTTTGSDTNPGTLARPMRTPNAALARARAQGKSVLVARGIYRGPVALVAGVSIFGGYRPDFRDRDLELYAVVLEAPAPGVPALTCTNVRTPTAVDGFTIFGADAVGAGEGSTAVFLDRCGPEVTLGALSIFAGRGSDGANGLDSTARLGELGFTSLADLDGTGGANGRDGNDAGSPCGTFAGGAGGRKTCGGSDVSGGAGGAAACPNLGCVNGRPCGNAGCTDFTVGGVCDFDAVLRVAVPNPAPSPGRGARAGVGGELTYNAPTNRGVCNFCDDNPTLARDSAHGADGGRGDDGVGGAGCDGRAFLELATGRVRAGGGGDGTRGLDGSGGGGASAGAGYAVIGGTSGGCSDRSGGSGGGGGAGDDDPPAGVFDESDDGGGAGGGGGGVLILDAHRRLVITGRVLARGGRGGEEFCDGGGGGGGSGGWVLLIAERTLPDVSMGEVDVSGGEGGGSLFIGARGGDGAPGRFDLGMTPRCADGVRNRDETDVDCGGTICAPCAAARMCALARDCASATCTAGTCE
ncbi:MAG: hypothetical protein KF729_27575 [Sandaracinaceae bacterium]|nr:hypothetical protein [Sandaracinaceae bacterium]